MAACGVARPRVAEATLNASGGFTPSPAGSAELRRQCRHIVRRLARQRAMLAAASSLVPIPGVDLATDLAMMKHLIGRINQHFGLTEAQIRRLATPQQALVLRLLAAAGGTLALRLTTPALLARILRLAGLRLGVMEAARFVPLAGQIVAAGIGYWTVSTVASRHIDQCERLLAELNKEGLRHD